MNREDLFFWLSVALVFQYDDLGTIGALYLAAVSAEDTRSAN